MSERPFMQLYVSDFIGDTLQLSTEQIGAYMLLLMAMWNGGGKLPSDEAKLARVARMSVKKWKAIADDLMAFFDVDGDHIRHNRLTKELQKSESKSQSRASAGAAGGAAKALKDKDARVANAMPTSQHLPDTITREESSSLRSEENARAPKPDLKTEFESHFWPLYPNKVGKPDGLRAFVKARQRADLETMISGLQRYVGKTDDRPWCNPSTWLNQDRWNDQPAQVARGQPPPQRPPSVTEILKAQVLEMQANERNDAESDRTGQAHGPRQALLGFAGSTG
jgi:uncharacterized protein YdaU (DUF1376 family)